MLLVEPEVDISDHSNKQGDILKAAQRKSVITFKEVNLQLAQLTGIEECNIKKRTHFTFKYNPWQK